MEPRAVNASYVVTTGADAGRVGLLVDVLAMDELFGGWREWFHAMLRLRPRRRWQAVWVVLEFPEGDRGAFRRSELEEHHG